MEAKVKHLEMIQAIISRMAHNSFLIKGWSVTLTVAIFVLAGNESGSKMVFLALLPAVIFWGLDGYFLRQERLFRKLYDEVRVLEESEITFSMNTAPYQNETASWFAVVFSETLFAFHIPIVAVILIAGIYLTFP